MFATQSASSDGLHANLPQNLCFSPIELHVGIEIDHLYWEICLILGVCRSVTGSVIRRAFDFIPNFTHHSCITGLYFLNNILP